MMQFRVRKLLTASLLGANGTYTSESLNLESYNRFTGKVFSDQSGTLDIQQSDDGNVWDTTKSVAVAASTVSTYDEALCAAYVRLKYTNGITAQGAFRLSGYANPMR